MTTTLCALLSLTCARRGRSQNRHGDECDNRRDHSVSPVMRVKAEYPVCPRCSLKFVTGTLYCTDCRSGGRDNRKNATRLWLAVEYEEGYRRLIPPQNLGPQGRFDQHEIGRASCR